jgi:hypothetical protein
MQKGPSDREQNRKIRSRFRDLEAPKRLGKHVLIRESQPAMLFEHGDQHRKATGIKPTRSPLRASKKARSHQRIDFAEQASCSRHRRNERAARCRCAPAHWHSKRLDLSEPITAHFK